MMINFSISCIAFKNNADHQTTLTPGVVEVGSRGCKPLPVVKGFVGLRLLQQICNLSWSQASEHPSLQRRHSVPHTVLSWKRTVTHQVSSGTGHHCRSSKQSTETQQLQDTLCQRFTHKVCKLDIQTVQSAVHEKPTWRRELCSVLALQVSVADLLARFGCVRACN